MRNPSRVGFRKRPNACATLTRGFTLTELIFVMVLIGFLSTMGITGISAAIERTRETICKNNLRNMIIAAHAYASENDGDMPPAYEQSFDDSTTTTWESFLWGYDMRSGNGNRTQQCPSFKGAANWAGDRYTGYNYNASYIGGVRYVYQGKTYTELSVPSANLGDIKTPSACAVFGDGQYAGGANKFMRSPYPGDLDADAGLATAGTQGFRHHHRSTNVAFADGSVRAHRDRHTKTAARGAPAKNCGFLSEDNFLYDLE